MHTIHDTNVTAQDTHSMNKINTNLLLRSCTCFFFKNINKSAVYMYQETISKFWLQKISSNYKKKGVLI